jgi:hypothetical protein
MFDHEAKTPGQLRTELVGVLRLSLCVDDD